MQFNLSNYLILIKSYGAKSDKFTENYHIIAPVQCIRVCWLITFDKIGLDLKFKMI